jgi:putative nucleotidyltransferase with HDIG domain
MNPKPLVQILEEAITDRKMELPVFNKVTLKLRNMIEDDNVGLADIAKVVQGDQALVSRVLKAANSAFFAGLNPVKTIREAIIRLGADAVLNIVISISQEPLYQSKRYGPRMKDLWTHALAVASAARWLSLNLGFHQAADECFLAGLFHDIGKLYILKIVEDLEIDGTIEFELSMELIDDIATTKHTQYGGLLMKQLNMTEAYIIAVERHHDMDVLAGQDIVNLVRLANVCCHKIGLGPKHEPDLLLSNTPEAMALNAGDLLLAELQVKLESQMSAFTG